jgi:CubicO group peptidase (beta-lactamase class C family)
MWLPHPPRNVLLPTTFFLICSIMHTHILSVVLFSALSTCQYISCPLLGPDFPVPSNLLNDAQIISASQNLSQQLDSLINGNSTDFDTSTSFSIQWFTAESNQSLFQYHYTGPSVAQSSNGTQNITGDSIYRVGSISKLYTMYLFMAEAGDQYFTRPITDFVPELAQAALDATTSGTTNATQWEDITVGALASQMAGIARDGIILPCHNC